MGAAAGKNLQAKEEGNTSQPSKKVKEIGNVESFDNEDDNNILVDDSQSSAGSPRTGLSPKFFQHVHNRSFHESQNNSPISRISALDNNSPTFHNKNYLDINTGTEKSVMEITNIDEDEDQIVDDDLSTVSKYVDEKHRKRKQTFRNKRSPMSNRNSFRRPIDDQLHNLSEVDEDDSTSVLSYDIGDDGTLGEDEDKYDLHSHRLSKNRKNLSPSSRAQQSSPRFSPAKSSLNDTVVHPSPDQKPSFSGLPRIKDLASEDKLSSHFPSTAVKSSGLRQTSGIQSLIKESQDILHDLESMAKNSSSAVKAKSNSSNLNTSLSNSQQFENGDYLDQKNAALIGLQRQKIWSYAHNAQLEREVQDLQRQLADLDSALGLDYREASSKREQDQKASSVSPDKTASGGIRAKLSPRSRRVAPMQQTPIESQLGAGKASVSSIVSGQQAAKDIKKNVANIRARANKIQSTPTSSHASAHSQHSTRHVRPSNTTQFSDDNDSDVTAGNSIITHPIVQKAVKVGTNSADVESADSDLEGSHSSIVEDMKLPTRHVFNRRESMTKRQALAGQLSNSTRNSKTRRGHDSSDTDNDGDTTVASHSMAVNVLDDSSSQQNIPVSTATKLAPSRSLRPLLQVQTNNINEITGIQSQPASTTSNNNNKVPRASRSNSGLTPVNSSGKGSHKHPTPPSAVAKAEAAEEYNSIQVEQNMRLEPIVTASSYQPSSPRHSSPRALRSDQNKDVLRRLNRRQKKFHDSEGEANSASEDESSSVVTSFSFNTPKPQNSHPTIPQPTPLQPISEAGSNNSSRQPQLISQQQQQQQHPPRRRGRNVGPIIKPSVHESASSSTSHEQPSLELQSKWHEVNLLLRRRIDSEADMQFTMAAAEAGLLYSDQLNAVAKSLNVLRGTISRWILPFDNNTRIDGQCSTPMSVLERMPEALRGKISDRQIHYLVSGANSVRQLVRIKIADDNDLEQAKQALKTSMDFFKKLHEEAPLLGLTPYQLLKRLQ